MERNPRNDVHGHGAAPTALVSWAEAPAHILRAAALLSPAPSVVVIGIAGAVGSGKSTLAKRLSACVVGTDSYLPDYDNVAYLERDEPRHADLPRLARDLESLRVGRPAKIPLWSFHTHRREGEQEVHVAPIVVCEGIHALHETVAPSLHLRVFVEASRAVRWSRWETIERQGERGWGVDVAREHFEKVAEPTFQRYAQVYRAAADVVVVNE